MTEASARMSRKGRLPADIYAALVETLFGTVGSFLSGILGGILAPAIAYARTQDNIFLVCLAAILGLSAFRLIVFLGHQQASAADRMIHAKRWDLLYGIGGVSFMTTVGVTSALLFHRHHDEVTTLYGVVIAMGCVGALAGRNSGRPMVVYGQVLGVCGPLAAILLVEYNVWYWGLSAILILVMTSAKSTTRFLNDIIVEALLTGREARVQGRRFSRALDSMSHGLCMGDRDGRIIVINRRLREFFHLHDAGELTARTLAERIAAAGNMSRDAEHNFITAWGTHVAKRDSSVFSDAIANRIYDFRCEPMDNGGFVMVAEDVTTARIASREIERMAHFDALTGLPNRIQFHGQMEARLARALPARQTVALLSVDLDQFKEVNDTRGHPTGDELLCRVAERLRLAVRPTDLVARYGGDEFQVLVQAEKPQVEKIAGAIISQLSQPYDLDGQSITIGATIGIAYAPTDADAAEELLRCADVALYQAKAERRGVYRSFDPAMDAAMRRKREIEQDLREAIANDKLDIYYQPVVDTRTGEVAACEALVRMNHPTKGVVSPGEFIAVAEETGLILELGSYVLRRACREAATWPKHVRVAVNFSPRQFALGKNMVDQIKAAVFAAGLEPDRLEVEITESTIIEAKDALAQLQQLSDGGIRIVLDDFGTGYSSLSYLRQFPVDKIKIDRSFAIDVKSKASQAVIGSVSVLAHLLNVELVIEGVETKAQLEAVKSWNVHLIQGYLFSRPKPLAEILPVLERPAPFSASHKLQSVA